MLSITLFKQPFLQKYPSQSRLLFSREFVPPSKSYYAIQFFRQLTSDFSFRLNLDKKTKIDEFNTFYKVYYCKLWRPTLLHEKNLFKPIYSKKYQVREKTNVEPLIPMDDQEIISPYSINTIHSKVYMRSSFFLLFSKWHVWLIFDQLTGITDLANYSLRKYPLYDLMRRSIRNVPGSLQCKLEDYFVHRDHIRISCTDVKFSPCVWLALCARLALTFDKNINLVSDKKISSAPLFIRD